MYLVSLLVGWLVGWLVGEGNWYSTILTVYIKVKVKLSLALTKHHAMRAY
jgi:hypothetical protein